MINISIVSEFNVIKDLLRSALKSQSNIDNVTIFNDTTLSVIGSTFKLNQCSHRPDIIVYDLDSLLKTPKYKLAKMLDFVRNKNISKCGISSLIVVTSETQLKRLNYNIGLPSDRIILKPFTFRQITYVVNNVWTSNKTK